MADSDEVLEVRRRARRRLIGATAVVLLLVIVPPWLMDLEPRPVTSTLTVEIPGKDQPKLDPRAGAPAVEAKMRQSNPTKAPPEPEVPKPAAKVNPVGQPPDAVKLPTVRESKAKSGAESQGGGPTMMSKADDAQRAAAILKNEVFFVPLGAYNSADNAKQIQQKVIGLGMRGFVDIVDVKGLQQSRVRAGPFNSRDAAEAARERLRGAGLDPGPVRTQ
jgi:DedD protein